MSIETVRVPDLGGAEEVEVIELTVAVGDSVAVEQTLLVLESEKATMELPAPVAGVVKKILVAEGDKIEREGEPLMEIEVSEAGESREAAPAEEADEEGGDAGEVRPPPEDGDAGAVEAPFAEEAVEAPSAEEEDERAVEPRPSRAARPQSSAAQGRATEEPAPDTESRPAPPTGSPGPEVYAGPYVRRLARELGVDLRRVEASGPRQRVLKEDVQAFVRQRLDGTSTGGGGIPPVPEVDYGRFGPVSEGELTKVGRLTAANMHRSWLNVPHVTQFDAADITELEAFRRGRAREAEARGVKLTACAAALRDNPVLNRALGADGASFVQREFFHLGMAVDTPRGLLVPVIREVDRKGIWELAAEIAEIADRARAGKLKVHEMQGACFTVSSLGAIGGEGFTPIINTPEVAILGVSRSAVRPLWNGSEFAPRTLLPLSLSYDHRVVNGADGGRFLTQVVGLLADIRALLL